MNRKQLIIFLQKISLNQTCNKIFITTDKKGWSVVAKDESNASMLKCDWKVKGDLDGGLGIYDVSQFKKFLNLLTDEELKLEVLTSKKEENYKLLLRSSNMEVEYFLAGEDSIPEVKYNLRDNIEYNFEFEIDEQLSASIIKSLDTTQTKFMMFEIQKKKLFVIIGDSDNAENIVRIQINNFKILNPTEITTKAFQPEIIRNILQVNKTVKAKLSMGNILTLENRDNDMKVEYHTIAIKHNR